MQSGNLIQFCNLLALYTLTIFCTKKKFKKQMLNINCAFSKAVNNTVTSYTYHEYMDSTKRRSDREIDM